MTILISAVFYLISWLIILNAIIGAYLILTRPEIEKKHIIRNKIEALVESEKHLSSSDRIVLMKKQIDLLDPEEIPIWQQYAFVNEVLEKFGFEGAVKKS